MITIDDVTKVRIRVGTVVLAERVEGSDKLLKLTVDMGEEMHRTVMSGIGKFLTPESLVDNQYCFISNLEYREIMGVESQAMILATGEGETFALVTPTKKVLPGSLLR